MCSLTAQCSDFNLDKQKVGTQCSLNPSVVLQTRARSTVFLWTLTDHQRSSAAFIETDANRHLQDAVRVIELWLPAPKPDKHQEMSQFNHTNRLHVRILFIPLFGLFLFPELGDTTVSPDPLPADPCTPVKTRPGCVSLICEVSSSLLSSSIRVTSSSIKLIHRSDTQTRFCLLPVQTSNI